MAKLPDPYNVAVDPKAAKMPKGPLPAAAPLAPKGPMKVKAAATPKKLFPRKGGNPFQQGLSANPPKMAPVKTPPVPNPIASTAGAGKLGGGGPRSGNFQSSMGLSGSGASKKKGGF